MQYILVNGSMESGMELEGYTGRMELITMVNGMIIRLMV